MEAEQRLLEDGGVMLDFTATELIPWSIMPQVILDGRWKLPVLLCTPQLLRPFLASPGQYFASMFFQLDGLHPSSDGLQPTWNIFEVSERRTSHDISKTPKADVWEMSSTRDLPKARCSS